MGDPSSQRSITVSTLSIKVGPGRRAETPGPTGEGLARTCTHLHALAASDGREGARDCRGSITDSTSQPATVSTVVHGYIAHCILSACLPVRPVSATRIANVANVGLRLDISGDDRSGNMV